MKTSELVRKVKKAGCHIKRHGSRHDVWVNPTTGETFSLPRHPSEEVPKGTAEQIMKAAGVK